MSESIIPKTKVCTRCEKEKSLDEFYRHRHGRFGRDAHCAECKRKAKREWRTPERNLRHRLKNRYGISCQEYERLLERSGGRCEICKQPPGEQGLQIDHDHKTNKVRGLLCISCNGALGLAKDNTETLQNMIAYLQENN